MILSALIPSRARPDKLVRCIESIKASCTNPDNVEIIVRIDDDDSASLDIANELRLTHLAFVMVGSRGRGWNDNALMFDSMVAIQNGIWSWFLNDDAYIEGTGWDTELESVPTTGFIVHPEFYNLGPSKHRHVGGGPFPIVPKNCWLDYGWKELQHPVDTAFDQMLVHQHRWKNHFLSGITFYHDRDEQEIMRQRKL